MKQILRTYIYTLFIIFIPFTLSSFILALLSYFIQYNSFILNIIIAILSYIILIIAALYFTSKIKKLHHSLIFAFLYFLFSLLIHLGNIHIINLICKPLVFIVIGLIKNRLNIK